MDNNADLIGQTYRANNGARWRVTGLDEEMPSLVFVERVADGRRSSAVGEFIRLAIQDQI